MKHRILALFCALTLTAGLLAGCGGEKKNETQTNSSSSKEEASQTEEEPASEEEAAAFSDGEDGEEAAAEGVQLDVSKPLTGIHHAQIIVQDYGTIEVELDADTAPITVTNFVKLAQEGFYDGLTFHRIMKDFMVQGGDPSGNGTGGSSETIKGEFSNNGVKNPISHERGVLSMARTSEYDSASSQFFIVHQDSDYLDGDYAAFGRVTEGMDVIDAICEEAKPTDDNGTIPKEQQPVMERVIVLD